MNYPPPPPPHGPQPPYGYGPQPYWAPPPRIDPKELKPSRTWYWLSAIPAVVGTILAIVFLVLFIEQLDPDIDNFPSNRTAVVEFHEGDRAIYVQTRDANTTLQVPPGELRCSVTSVAGGERVPLERASGSTLDVNTDTYVREYSFDAPRDGRYRVRCDGPDDLNLAIGPDLSFGLFAPLIWAIVAFLAGALVAGAIAIATAVRRSNHKHRLEREARERQASGLA